LLEIMEYAAYLGMNLNEDRELFYIAKEGLKAPLPSAWKPCKTVDGEIYYFNFESGESIWEHPCDEYYRRLYITEKENLERKMVERQIKAREKKVKKVLGPPKT
jgi:hypothetical protein